MTRRGPRSGKRLQGAVGVVVREVDEVGLCGVDRGVEGEDGAGLGVGASRGVRCLGGKPSSSEIKHALARRSRGSGMHTSIRRFQPWHGSRSALGQLTRSIASIVS